MRESSHDEVVHTRLPHKTNSSFNIGHSVHDMKGVGLTTPRRLGQCVFEVTPPPALHGHHVEQVDHRLQQTESKKCHSQLRDPEKATQTRVPRFEWRKKRPRKTGVKLSLTFLLYWMLICGKFNNSSTFCHSNGNIWMYMGMGRGIFCLYKA